MDKIAAIRALFSDKGYCFYEKELELNIIGVRKENKATNFFDDQLLLLYRQGEEQIQRSFPITTDPGHNYLKDHFLNPEGCAVLVPGQYVDAYAIALHQGKYEALCQRNKPVQIVRDSNRDEILDMRPAYIHSGYYGINIHRAAVTGETAKVNKYSAGCQVFQNAQDFAVFMDIARDAAAMWGNTFTYTLIMQHELDTYTQRLDTGSADTGAVNPLVAGRQRLATLASTVFRYKPRLSIFGKRDEEKG